MSIRTPLVSVISGYYNRERYVDDSIQSLINQTYTNIEIIIFDDCSTDNTYEKLTAFELKDSRIKVIRHQTNLGFVQGLINAVNISSGEYVAIHGSGDFSFPKRIERQVMILEEELNVGVVGCFREVEKERDGIAYNKTEITGKSRDFIMNRTAFSHGEVMFRRALYDKVGGYRPLFKYAQDRDLWCRMSRVSELFVVPEVLYRRRFLPEGVGITPSKLMVQRLLSHFAVQCHREVLAGREDPIDKFGIHAMLFLKPSKVLANNFSLNAIRFIRTGNLEAAKLFSTQAISYKKTPQTLMVHYMIHYLNQRAVRSIFISLTAWKRRSSTK